MSDEERPVPGKVWGAIDHEAMAREEAKENERLYAACRAEREARERRRSLIADPPPALPGHGNGKLGGPGYVILRELVETIRSDIDSIRLAEQGDKDRPPGRIGVDGEPDADRRLFATLTPEEIDQRIAERERAVRMGHERRKAAAEAAAAVPPPEPGYGYQPGSMSGLSSKNPVSAQEYLEQQDRVRPAPVTPPPEAPGRRGRL